MRPKSRPGPRALRCSRRGRCGGACRNERDALIETGLHWIGHRQPDADGLLYIVNSTAAYLAAMPHILDEISNVTGAHAFHVRNLPLLKGQRVTVSRLKT
ncbi:hypothetical protein SMA5143A_3154 [Streptomyces sp. MA5143a]|nr:hypothetical protein SMA5143A_3154 [Streptomyces sp. MA5143a]